MLLFSIMGKVNLLYIDNINTFNTNEGAIDFVSLKMFQLLCFRLWLEVSWAQPFPLSS